MDKFKKKMLIASGLIICPAIINYAILKKFELQNRNLVKEKYHSFKYGDIHYKVKGQGKPLLLIHGVNMGSGLHEWDENIELLSKKFKVYAIDLLGFGYSDKPQITYSPYMYVNLILDFVKNVIGEKVFIAANGNSAAYTIFASLFEPKYFEKMILINPTGISDGIATNKRTAIRKVFETPILGTSLFNMAASKQYIKMFLEKYAYSSSVSKKTIDDYYNAAHFGGFDAKNSTAYFVSKFLNNPIKHKISSITIPTMVLWGEDNVLNEVENADIFRQSKIKVVTFGNTKLLPHTEKPREFYLLCKKFFD